MTKERPLREPHTKHYVTFDMSLWKLAFFLGTTERYYDGKIKRLKEQIQRARSELSHVETELDEFAEKGESSKLSKAEEERLGELIDKADDLTDVKIFVPMDVSRFRQYPELLRIFGLSYLVTIFEGYLVDIVRDILLVRPDALKSQRPLTAETVLSLGERQKIVSYLAEIEVDELLYKSFPDVIRYFDKKFNIELSASGVASAKIVEIMATRNIHVHNRGFVNQRYLDLVKNGKLKAGAYKPITKKYLRDSISSALSLVKFIDDTVQRKYFADSATMQNARTFD
ncbi:MAG: hypothetical protein NTU41_00185 [Chloroflexi bacterium]|nr:hypothetical protein [Chloroflexota bacterium]